jgi:hypothetical protein
MDTATDRKSPHTGDRLMRGQHIRSVVIAAMIVLGALGATHIARAANASNSEPDFAAIRRTGVGAISVR